MQPDRGPSSRPTSVSPPPKRRRIADPSLETNPKKDGNYRTGTQSVNEDLSDHVLGQTAQAGNTSSVPASWTVASPVQLNFIEQLPRACNIDTVSLGSILGDVMIQECWLFNYLFDLDFVM